MHNSRIFQKTEKKSEMHSGLARAWEGHGCSAGYGQTSNQDTAKSNR